MPHRPCSVIVALMFACRREPAVPPDLPEPDVELASAVATDDSVVRSTGVAFRQAYPRCAHDFDVGMAGGEVFVIYATDGLGRIDRLGPRGEVVEALDLDPGIEKRGEAKSRRSLASEDGWPPKSSHRSLAQSMGHLESLLGSAVDDFFVAATFRIDDSEWTSRVAHYRDGRWSELRERHGWLFEWKGKIMTYGDDDADSGFLWADEDMVAPNFDDLLKTVATARDVEPESVRAADVMLASWSADPTGLLAVLATHVPDPDDPSTQLGTWLVVWSDPKQAPTIDRITSRVADASEADLRVIGRRVFIQLGDEPQFEWRSGQAVPVPGLQEAQATAARCDRGNAGLEILGRDMEGRTWAQQGNCLAIQDGEAWSVEPLPHGIYGLNGIEFAAPWAMDERGMIWSREGPGRWASHELNLSEEDKPVWSPSLYVTGAGDAWIEVTYDESHEHEQPLDSLGRSWFVSELYTTRAIEKPNPCRSATTPDAQRDPR